MTMQKAMSSDTLKLPLDLIDPNPNQPRQVFDEEKLQGLAQSIKELGVIQPIVVELSEISDDETRYIIHDGERRWRASRLAGLTEIPVVISAKANVADIASGEEERLSRALVANLQREDLNAIEVAQGYQNLHDLGWSDKKIGQKVASCSRSKVANSRRLLALPDEIRQPIAEGKISERQAQALIPIYKLPAVALEKARDADSWQTTPEKLIKAAINGQSSVGLRNDVSHVIRRSTSDMTDYAFTDHAFDFNGDNVFQAPACQACPVIIKRENKLRCPDFDCLSQKKEAWRELRLAKAAEVSGLQPLPDHMADMWKKVESFGSDLELAKLLLADGCPHENLRLTYEPHFDLYPTVEGYSDVKIWCYHGEGGKRCKCLAAAKRESTKNDPDVQAEKDNKQRLENEIVVPAAQVLASALAAGSTDAWRLLLPRMAHVYLDKVMDWDLEKIQLKIARSLVSDSVPWNGYMDINGVRDRVQDRLAQAGLTLPDNTGLAKIEKRLARVLAWVEAIADETPLAQIEGNFRNLNELLDELDDLEAETEAQEQAIRGMIGLIAAGLETLKKAKDEEHDRKFLKSFVNCLRANT